MRCHRRWHGNRQKGMSQAEAVTYFFAVCVGESKGGEPPFGTRPCLQGLVCYACSPTGVKKSATGSGWHFFERQENGKELCRLCRQIPDVFGAVDRHITLVLRLAFVLNIYTRRFIYRMTTQMSHNPPVKRTRMKSNSTLG